MSKTKKIISVPGKKTALMITVIIIHSDLSKSVVILFYVPPGILDINRYLLNSGDRRLQHEEGAGNEQL